MKLFLLNKKMILNSFAYNDYFMCSHKKIYIILSIKKTFPYKKIQESNMFIISISKSISKSINNSDNMNKFIEHNLYVF